MGIVWQLLLVSNMVGIESHLALEFVTMVTDLRALGVPVAYSSLPSFVAAIMSGLLIVCLSFVSQKYANSTTGKALLLVLINVIQFVGATLIIVGNMIKLMYYKGQPLAVQNNSSNPEEVKNDINILNLSSSTFSKKNGAITLVAGNNSSCCNDSLYLDVDSDADSFLPFPLYAAVVMLGYALAESGFDAGNCFLKTYILACTSSNIHSSVLVKSVLMGSFGGLFITLLGSSSIGEWLAAGTQHNVDAVNTLFIASAAFIIGLVTLSVSLISGMAGCCRPQTYQTENLDEAAGYEIAVSEKKKLLVSAARKKSDKGEAHLALYEATSKPPSTEDCSDSSIDSGTSKESRNVNIKDLVQIFRQNIFRICLCAGTLFACWAVFSFNVYSVNFVGAAIYQGNSSAPVNSEAYHNFLKGERAGSTGLLLVYLSYMSIGSFQKTILDKFGWWSEASLLSVVFIVINFCCAYFLKVWLYYMASCLTGLYRVLIYTIPYLLITRASDNEPDPNKTGGKKPDKNRDIAIIAALWPSSFLVAASITGPLLSWTGNAASPVYVTVAVAIIALIFYFCIRKF